jgi:N-dimethylarginine dimethylaminohydrolase
MVWKEPGMKLFGGQSSIAEVRQMLVKHVSKAYISQENIDQQWRNLNYLGKPDFTKAVDEYEAFLALIKSFDLEIHYLPQSDETGLDSIYTHDPLFIFDRGAVLLNMGKQQRSGEPGSAGVFLESMGIPVSGKITGEGRVECGDILWLDERTLAVGEGYRTNAEGIRQLRHILGDAVDEIIPVPLPHWTGPEDCLHLLSNISPVDRDLAVVYSRLLPVPFRLTLLERGYKLVEVPDEEYDTMGCNVLPLAPCRCIVLDGNPKTKARLEKEGVEVLAYRGEEISLKGAGGPTCLTRPLLRV